MLSAKQGKVLGKYERGPKLLNGKPYFLKQTDTKTYYLKYDDDGKYNKLNLDVRSLLETRTQSKCGQVSYEGQVLSWGQCYKRFYLSEFRTVEIEIAPKSYI